MKKIIYIVMTLLIMSPIFSDWNFHSEDKEWEYYHSLNGDIEKDNLIYHQLVENQYNRGFNLEPLSALSSFNSSYARGSNDGAPWQGRGLNYRMDFGVSYSNSWFSLLLAPEFWIAQNSDFSIMNTQWSSGYGDYYPNEYDALQRYGDEPFYDFTLGQSSAEFLIIDMFAISLGAKNYQYGSSKYNPVIMSNHAKGIPSLNLGTKNSVETPIGGVEFHISYGQLNSSDFYEGNYPKSFISTMAIGYQPKVIPGLTLGANTLYYRPWENIDANDAVGNFRILIGAITSGGRKGATGGHSGNDDSDQVASITVDWTLPGSGFHSYLEWGRNDFNGGARNFLLNPEHSQALTVGVSKLFTTDIGDFTLGYEFTEMAQERDYVYHDAGPWYRHGKNGRGFSNTGQTFGAPIGPGSNSQTVEIGYYRERQKYQLLLNRTLYDNDYYYNHYIPSVGLDGSNYTNSDLYANRVELSAGVKATIEFRRFDLLAGVTVSNFLNRDYIPANDQVNFYGQLGIRAFF